MQSIAKNKLFLKKKIKPKNYWLIGGARNKDIAKEIDENLKAETCVEIEFCGFNGMKLFTNLKMLK
jgi:hypothetical protein